MIVKISIIIPTYKHRDFVVATLESVFAQSYRDFEVIVVNDGSPDDTAAVLAPYVASGRIHYVEQANQGQAAARNKGIAMACGEYIALLDDDDLWPVDKLQWQLSALEADLSAGAVAGYAQNISATGESLGKSHCPGRLDFESLFGGNPILSPGQVLIRSQVLRQVGGFNGAIWGADDWDLWFRIARAAPILFHDTLALHYRVHANNASRQVLRMLENCDAVVRGQLQACPPAARPALRRRAYRFIASTGERVVQQARHDAVRGHFIAAFQNLAGLSRLFLPSLRDPSIARRLASAALRG